MAGLFNYVSSLLGGGNGGEEGADGGAHGHSHNGQPCHGHGAPPPQMMMGGGGGHGHSHGGQPCHGHGAPPPQMMMGGGGGHGHSHGGQPCHGHGGGGSSQQPLPQIKEFAFSRDQLLTFFNRFIAELEKPETKQRLRDAVAAKEQVEEATEKVQRELLADMKIDVENGLASLQHVQRMYATDREVMQTFLQFVTCESMACDEAEMTPEEFQKKVENVQNEMKQRQITAVQQRAAMMGLAEDKQAELVAMLKEEQEKLGPRAPLVEQQNMMMRVQAKLQSMLVLTPDQEERLRRVAAERMEARQRANPGLTDQQVMQQAMQKLQLASQMMKQSGLSEEQVAQELMKRLREGNFEVSSAHSHGGVPCSHSHGAPGEPAGHDDADDVPEELTAQTKVERT